MPKNVDGVDGARVLNIIERVERLTEEKKALDSDIKDIWLEAKAAGHNVPICKKLVSLRKMDPEDRVRENLELEVHMQAIGMMD